ncbi:Lcl C-terminal domain-containing protein [Rheinheimera gaetbuli]
MIFKRQNIALVTTATLLSLLGVSPAQANTLINGRYVDNNDGTLTDTVTKLTWQRCSLGQTWQGSACNGNAARYRGEQALELSKEGWRLPSIAELDTLVQCKGGRQPDKRAEDEYINDTNAQCQGEPEQPTINAEAFPATAKDWYWSATSHEESTGSAWRVSFENGSVYYDNKVYSLGRVRLVRSGQ